MAVVYVDVESQGRNEVKPSQTSPGGGQSKVPGGEEEERKNPHQRDQHSQSVRILSPWISGGGWTTDNSEGRS